MELMNDNSGPLQRVYAATTPDELTSAYEEWAADYDRETIAMGYCLPFVVTAWASRHIPRQSGPLLDAGCGTGLSGPCLAALGYAPIEGLDSSRDMLELAAGRGVYADLRRAELGRALPWQDDHFAGFVSSGVFTEGHAPASGLEELVRITRHGGHAVFTVRDSLLERGGFRETFLRLEHEGRWRPVEESEPFRAFVLAEPEVTVRAFVFEIV
jgi:predicted TPR repeat methyltransferase